MIKDRCAIIVGEGIGNQVQYLPFISSIMKIFDKVDIISSIDHAFKFTHTIFQNHPQVHRVLRSNFLTRDDYYKYRFTMPMVTDIGISEIQLSHLSNTFFSTLMKISEVENNYNSVIDSIQRLSGQKYSLESIIENDLPNQWYKTKSNYSSLNADELDIVIHNGCNIHNTIRDYWGIKLIKNIDDLIRSLKDKYPSIKIASIGSPHEYIDNTINLTGTSFDDTFNIISRCKNYISNDTGTYHIASHMKKKGIVLFTATSLQKNYNQIFHKSFIPYRQSNTLSNCEPCQKFGNGSWLRCIHQSCRDINIDEVLNIYERIR